MSVISTLENYLNQGKFKLLLNDEDLNVLKDPNFDWFTQASNSLVVLTKNIKTDEKTYNLLVHGSPIQLQNLTENEICLLDTNNFYICGFVPSEITNPTQESILLRFNAIENSYDDSSLVRETIKSLLDKFYSYNEEFITSCFDMFDGCNITMVESLFMHHETKSCGFSCFEDNTTEVDINTVDHVRNQDLCKRFLNLYGLLNDETESFVESLKDVFDDRNLKIVWNLPQKSKGNPNFFYIEFVPKIEQNPTKERNVTRMESIKRILDFLVSKNVLDHGRSSEMIDWVNEGNTFCNVGIFFKKVSTKIHIQPTFSVGLGEIDVEQGIFDELPWSLGDEKINYDSLQG